MTPFLQVWEMTLSLLELAMITSLAVQETM
jgi:hypothetical protein